MRPTIGITLGEAAGVGPEVAVVAARDRRVAAACRPLLIGSADVAAAGARVAGVPPKSVHVASAPEELLEEVDGIQVLDTDDLHDGEWTPGVLSQAAGRAAARETARAVALATDGTIDAIVSAPVNKRALELGGAAYPGQTGYLEALTGSPSAMTILVGGPMRVALLSSHVSLTQAINLVTRESVLLAVQRLARALDEAFGISRPRIAVAALNPHASDDGLMGVEEGELIEPAVQDLQALGLDVVGPVPADALFLQADRGAYDGILALYHDQGVVPLKRHGYATFAYGLPVLRTTVGHGSAYNIAGQGKADATPMVNAIMLASDLWRVRARRGATTMVDR
ncbi:PdxA family dehydrogenase [Baekduia alba]|uniref:PdxA family dehydrogenase n=1 Tax=Baekduia alba TaxID=2997333 RepID=UPI002340AFFF|nr:4-hydroxythreonine-4-phosphate dehydrogenase PdxA [Baekduia alba]